MQHRVLLVLLAALLLGACDEHPAQIDLPTLEAMRPQLSRDLTPSRAEEAFGQPDQVTGSGLLIYVYRLEAGHHLYLGFPGYDPIVYAKLRSPDGTFEDLQLRS